jgi:hypothetical protein
MSWFDFLLQRSYASSEKYVNFHRAIMRKRTAPFVEGAHNVRKYKNKIACSTTPEQENPIWPSG